MKTRRYQCVNLAFLLAVIILTHLPGIRKDPGRYV